MTDTTAPQAPVAAPEVAAPQPTASAPASMPQPDPALFSPENEVKAMFVKWGKIGDWFEGTLHDIRDVSSQLPGQEGKMQKIYEFVARAGVFHDRIVIQDPATGEDKVIYKQIVLQKGDVWSVGGNKAIDDQMRRVVSGQIFGIRFTESKKSKRQGFADTKVRKVYPGAMDPEYTGSTTGVDRGEIRVEDIQF